MIRTGFVLLVAGLVGLFVQSSLVRSSFPSAMAPDFILVLVVLLALRRRTVDSLFAAFFLGLLADFASGRFVGPNAAGAVVAFGIVGVLSSRVYAERGFALALITFLCCLAKSSTYLLMMATYVNVAIFDILILEYMLIEAALSAVAAPILINILAWSRQTPSKKKKRSSTKGSAYGWVSQ